MDDGAPEGGDDPVVVPITGELDLHSFAPRDVASLVSDYVQECAVRGITRLRLIHGRGRGVQRAEVRRVLSRLPEVEWFGDADEAGGGWGATLAHLRPSTASDKSDR